VSRRSFTLRSTLADCCQTRASESRASQEERARSEVTRMPELLAKGGFGVVFVDQCALVGGMGTLSLALARHFPRRPCLRATNSWSTFEPSPISSRRSKLALARRFVRNGASKSEERVRWNAPGGSPGAVPFVFRLLGSLNRRAVNRRLRTIDAALVATQVVDCRFCQRRLLAICDRYYYIERNKL